MGIEKKNDSIGMSLGHAYQLTQKSSTFVRSQKVDTVGSIYSAVGTIFLSIFVFLFPIEQNEIASYGSILWVATKITVLQPLEELRTTYPRQKRI